MSSANVLPSAPGYDVVAVAQEQRATTETSQQLYPVLPNAENFRFTNITDFEKELANEVDHYRRVGKKYKKAHSIVHGSAIGLGSIAAGLSSAGLATALTGIGVIASVPLAGIAGLGGFSSAGLTAFSKKLETKTKKHEKIQMLAVAKQNSVSELVSKDLADNHITDNEFNIIVCEVQKCHELKGALRSGKKMSKHPPPDRDKIRQQIRLEEREKLKKRLSVESKLDLKS